LAAYSYVDRVAVTGNGQVVASHARCYGRGEQILDPLHYLATLERRPAALDHAPVYRDWKPAVALATLRRELEERHGASPGTRPFIRVLQLLAEHPEARVARAIEVCRAGLTVSAEAIAHQTRVLAQIEAFGQSQVDSGRETTRLPPITVSPPDLSQFNRLLGGGEPTRAIDSLVET
jgi:hypothetical protein